MLKQNYKQLTSKIMEAILKTYVKQFDEKGVVTKIYEQRSACIF